MRTHAPPQYRKRTRNGQTFAVVTLTDHATGRRKDYYLGPYGSDQSRQRYARLLAEWEAGGRRLPGVAQVDGGMTITELCWAYWQAIREHHDRGELRSIAIALRVLRSLHGDVEAHEFGPNALRIVRAAMVAGDLAADPPRRPWARSYCNSQVGRIVAMFRWGVAHERVAPFVLQALRSIEPLRAGAAGVFDRKRVEPVDDQRVDLVLLHVSRQVAALIRLQRCTGMRPGEAVLIRPADVHAEGGGHIYKPTRHKTAHRGRERVIRLGPRAMEILRPWLRRPADAFCFSPREARAEATALRAAMRLTPEGQGNSAGTNRLAGPIPPREGDRYTPNSYARAIARACAAAGIRRWHPHQLRHSFATQIRQRYGLEAAQLLLGHSSALVTEAVYAERDQKRMADIVNAIG